MPEIELDLGWNGASVSLDKRGFHYTTGSKTARLTAGNPGAGISRMPFPPAPDRPHVEQDLGFPIGLGSSPQPGQIGPEAVGNASAGEITALSTSKLAPILNEAAAKFRIAVFITLLSLLFLLAALLRGNQLWLGLSALYAIIFVPLAILLDRYRRSVTIIYDSRGVAALITEALAAAFTKLSACEAVWTVHPQGRIADWTGNAGATGQVRRRRIKLRFERPGCIAGNLEFPAFKSGSSELYLVPDAALTVVNGVVAAISYRDLEFSKSVGRFIEQEQVPSDATIVDHTWYYVNEAGGPGRRFNSNIQLPVCIYGQLSFRSEGGLDCTLQFSNPSAADAFSKVIDALRRTTAELPKSITYVEGANSWPTAAFLCCALLLGIAQLGFLKNGDLPKDNLAGSPDPNQPASTYIKPPPFDDATGTRNVKLMPPAQPFIPPFELKPPALAPADPGSDTSMAGTDARAPIDLNDGVNVRWVQSRLRRLGFLRGGSTNWDAASRSALHDFKATNNIANDDKWDLTTQELLGSGSAVRADQTFVGSWSETTCDPKSKPDIVINSRRATSAEGGVCEFYSLKYAGTSWSVGTTCSNGGEKWSATIRLALANGKLLWTGRDGTETQYARCR